MPDPLTHASVSLVIARHGFKDHKLLFVLAGLSPDIDVFIGGVYILIWGPWPASVPDFFHQSLIFHPGLSAAIWFMPVYCLILSWVFRKLGRRAAEKPFSRIYTLVVTGMLVHLGLDFLMTGNRPFWPLDVTAGFDVLPYSPVGQLFTMTAAAGLLIVDTLIAFLRSRSLNSLNTRPK